MREHTKGPWRVEVFSGTDYEVRAGGYLVAKVFSDPAVYTPSNAALIAAAPDLLSALRELELAVDSDMRLATTPRVSAALDDATRAIAKAEGR